MKIEAGEYVIVILHSPREKLFGILDEVSAAGAFIRGVDLGYFEDWCRAIAAGEPHLPMNDYFLPMWRIERITRDEGNETFSLWRSNLNNGRENRPQCSRSLFSN